jgi:hypothetical protein
MHGSEALAMRPSSELDADRVERLLCGLRSVELQRRAIGLLVERHGPGSAARALDDLARRAARGASRARSAWLPVAQWIISRSRDPGDAALEPLRDAAGEEGLVTLAAVLRSGPARKTLPAAARCREAASLDADEIVFPLSEAVSRRYPARQLVVCAVLGDDGQVEEEKRVPLARLALCDRRDLKRIFVLSGVVDAFARSPSGEFFVRSLLADGSLETRDLLSLVSKRPPSPAVAFAAALSSRWGAIPSVHEALASNPFTPSVIVAPLLPILSRRTRDALAKAAGQPTGVGEAAALLSEIDLP